MKIKKILLFSNIFIFILLPILTKSGVIYSALLLYSTWSALSHVFLFQIFIIQFVSAWFFWRISFRFSLLHKELSKSVPYIKKGELNPPFSCNKRSKTIHYVIIQLVPHASASGASSVILSVPIESASAASRTEIIVFHLFFYIKSLTVIGYF